MELADAAMFVLWVVVMASVLSLVILLISGKLF